MRNIELGSEDSIETFMFQNFVMHVAKRNDEQQSDPKNSEKSIVVLEANVVADLSFLRTPNRTFVYS